MGLSSSKQKTTSSQDTKENATVTPTNPPWVTEQVQAQGKNIQDFMARDPQSLVAGPSPLQNKAFSGVDRLGGWQAGNAMAQDMAARAGTAPAQTASVSHAAANGYSAPMLGPANQAGNVLLAPTERASAASLLDNFQAYLDPGTRALVDATLAEYDANTGRQAAALKAQAAGAGAFGGSRHGLAEAQFWADQGRGRALTDAELRSRAFAQAAGLAMSDADRRQNVDLFNVGQANDRSLAQGSYDLQTNQFNADALNRFALSQAELAANADMFNADARNKASMFNAGADNTAGMFNAEQANAALQRELQAAGLIGSLATDAGTQARADLGMTADLGAIQQAIAQAQAAAPATQLLTASQAMGAMPYNLFHGQDTSGTSSSNGTSVTKSKPSLFNQLLAAGQVASGF